MHDRKQTDQPLGTQAKGLKMNHSALLRSVLPMWEIDLIKKLTLTIQTLFPTAKKLLIWEKDTSNYYRWHLIVRRNAKTKCDYKYSLCNEEKSVSIHRLAYMQGQRYWIERMFKDAKGECGMADYEARG